MASCVKQVAVATLAEKRISEVVVVYLLLTHVVVCFQHVPPEVWWYYIIELGFYCSLMLSLFMDGKRKVRTLNYSFTCVKRRTRINAEIIIIFMKCSLSLHFVSQNISLDVY